MISVSPPIGVGEGDGEMGREEDGRWVSFWRVGLKGTERSSGYVWKNRGAKVVPKNAPVR